MPRLKNASLCDLLGNLHRQLARRTKDEHLHLAQLRVGLFDRGNGERGSLARTGLRLAHDVASGHQQGDGFGLDRRGLFEAELVNGLEQFLGQAEIGK